VRGRQIEPFVGLHDITGDAEAFVVHQAEQILPGGVALFGGEKIIIDRGRP
jgi:hypothetical protein